MQRDDSEDICTLTITGFAADVREREFRHMFMFAAGIEAAELAYDCGSVVGIARFSCRADALNARDLINLRRVFYDRGQSLKAVLAERNLSERKQSADHLALPLYEQCGAPFAHRSSKDLGKLFERISSPLSVSSLDTAVDDFVPATARVRRGSVIRPPETCEMYFEPDLTEFQGDYSNSFKGASWNRMRSVFGKGSPLPFGENAPCNTLYVGNLPSNSSEDELRALFIKCDGYKRLSYKLKPNGPMCFVEFEDLHCATNAMNELYGTVLSTSCKGGIRLSYSKNPLGVRPVLRTDDGATFITQH